MSNKKICSKGIWDETVPGIKFDENGISNYAKIQLRLMNDYPRGKKGKLVWEKIVEEVKSNGKNKKYDCIIGISGGTDSSYLLHVLKEYDLRPLAVNLDNGWNSEIAVANIKNMTDKLNVDLETYVIDYEEIKDLMRSYMLACLPWIDVPSDLAIKATLYLTAVKEKVGYIFTGTDFRSEGKQPTEWTYSDDKQLKFVHNKFGRTKLSTYPILNIGRFFYLGYFKKIKKYSPFNYLDYQKSEAQKFLINNYSWKNYGEHHHENLFTKFAISYWQYEKFGIDKRKITYSAQVLSGQINREQALSIVASKPYVREDIDKDIDYILKKLDFDKKNFETIWNSPNRTFLDYPSYYLYFQKFHQNIWPVLSKMTSVKPKIFYEFEERNKK